MPMASKLRAERPDSGLRTSYTEGRRRHHYPGSQPEKTLRNSLFGACGQHHGQRGLSRGPLNSVVVDIGGTTSDISLLIEGQPLYASKGALIRGHLTHIHSFAVNSIALGGDSLVYRGIGRFEGGTGAPRTCGLFWRRDAHRDRCLQRPLGLQYWRYGGIADKARGRSPDAWANPLEELCRERCGQGSRGIEGKHTNRCSACGRTNPLTKSGKW